MAGAYRSIACALAGAATLACGGREIGEMADGECGMHVGPLPDVHVAVGEVVDLPLPVEPGPDESSWIRMSASGVPDLNAIISARVDDEGAGVLTISPDERHIGAFELTLHLVGESCEGDGHTLTVVVTPD